MADTETRACLEGEAGLHRDGDKAAMARYVYWPLLVEAGLVWAQNNKATEDYPEGKYPDIDGKPNYMHGIAHTKIMDSILRHLTSWLCGEDTDPESKRSHLAHAMCCLNMLAYLVENKPELDDRPLKPAIRPGSTFEEDFPYLCVYCGRRANEQKACGCIQAKSAGVEGALMVWRQR